MQDDSPYEVNPGKSLDFLVKAAQAEYAQVTIERRAMQYGLVKQYMWLASLIVTGAGTLWIQPGNHGCLVTVGLALAVIPAVAAFAFALLALKGKGMDAAPYDRWWNEFAEMAYNCSPETIQQSMLENFDASIRAGYDVVTRRALNLRWVCRLLLFSALVLICTVAAYGLEVGHGG